MTRRFGEFKRPTAVNNKWNKGGELPCKRCGFRYQEYGPDAIRVEGKFILCRFCYDSETD